MGKTTIEWTSTRVADADGGHQWMPGYTFNPWHGCYKKSAGCERCYAWAIDRRWHKGAHWGRDADRKMQSVSYWDQPHKWNTIAARLGERLKVFCASMADVFEYHRPTKDAQLKKPRRRLWDLVEATPMLDWLILTKEPENVESMVPERWARGPISGDPTAGFPPNLWLGVTAENQAEADRRLPILRKLSVFRRFVSYEPALEQVDWSAHLSPCRCRMCGRRYEYDDASRPERCMTGSLCHGSGFEPQIHWLICGAESGPGARPMDEAWARSARDACERYGVRFFLKQFADRGRKVSLPVLDGQTHRDQPATSPLRGGR